jgi:glutamate 5-kinase
MKETPHSSVLRDARRIVVKVGSSLVTNEGKGLDETAIGEWCRQMAFLAKADPAREIIMVSSGAIAEGMKRLGWTTRPKAIHELQAAAEAMAAERLASENPTAKPEAVPTA